MSENNQENDGKLFQKGGPGGPGRGKKVDKYPEAEDLNEFKRVAEPKVRRVILTMLDSKDQKMQIEGAKLHARVYGLQAEDHKKGVLDPEILKGIGKYFFEDTKQDNS